MSNLKKSFLMGTAAAGTALLASAFFSILAVHAACTNPSTIPTGFASPCPVFSLSNASVTQAQSLTLSATPQAGTDYIYTTAYVSNGTTWNPYTLSGNNAYPSYSSALASLTLSSTQLSALSLGTHYAVVWDWLWDATAGCYKGPGLNQCNTGAWRVQSFSITSSYAYSQSSYYAYSQGSYYAYSQSAYTSSTNLALGILPTASAAFSSGSASQITDNDLNTANWVSIGSGGAQWIKLDLGNTYSLTDIKVWHYYGDGRTYHDVIVQVSNDATYASGVTTVFSNDTNNSAGQGIGGNAEYAETSLGKDIAFPAVSARYVRLWTNGSTANVDNHYVEVEVFGTGGTYAYSQSSYYSYSQSAYVSYAYSQSTYYAYSQSAYTSGTVYNVKTSACGPSGTNAAGNGTTDDGGVIRS